jgi:nitrile hydratase
LSGAHDLGGRQGFGPIVRERDEPVFHEAWEGRTLALARAMLAGSHFNQAEFRHVKERMAPATYHGSSYYQRWLEGSITLLLEKGVITQEEFDARLDELAKGTG